jgi:hypothetical protein
MSNNEFSSSDETRKKHEHICVATMDDENLDKVYTNSSMGEGRDELRYSTITDAEEEVSTPASTLSSADEMSVLGDQHTSIESDVTGNGCKASSTTSASSDYNLDGKCESENYLPTDTTMLSRPRALSLAASMPNVETVVSKAKRAASSLWLLLHAQVCRSSLKLGACQ